MATNPFTHGQRQPGLADPARPGQRHQPHPRLAEETGQFTHGLLPPDQRRGPPRQRARAPLGQGVDRREVGGKVSMGQLVDKLRLGQIAQPELPQLLKAKSAAQTPCHQIAGGLSDQHLPALRGRLHPGTPVDRRVVDIVAFLHMRLAGVQPHPHPQRRTRRPRLTPEPQLADPAASTAATALANAAKKLSPSPREATTTPPRPSITSVTIRFCRPSAASIAPGAVSHSRVEPSMSVSTNVTVPAGSSAPMLTTAPAKLSLSSTARSSVSSRSSSPGVAKARYDTAPAARIPSIIAASRGSRPGAGRFTYKSIGLPAASRNSSSSPETAIPGATHPYRCQ